jgi:hypothetical protein
VTDAVRLSALLSVYCAVIVAEPCGNCVPLTGNVAVAVPADPTSAAEPSELPPAENITKPVGVTPFVPVTVAMRKTTFVVATVVKLLNRARLALGGGGPTVAELHFVTNLLTSTEPSPVT